MLIRAAQLGYPSSTAYVEGLARYDILCQSKHGVTILWSMLSCEDQDWIEKQLLERLKAGKGMRATEAAKLDWKTLQERPEQS